MSDSTPMTHTSNKINTNGAAQVKVAPIPPERYTNGTGNGASSNGVSVPKSGARIPIDINAIGKSNSNAAKMMKQANAAIPDVMADDISAMTEDVAETVEQQVNRLRPKTLAMQLRFLY